MLQLTITDCKQSEGVIVCSYDGRLCLRRHNLPADEDFILPDMLLKRYGKYFNLYERQFLDACHTFNQAINSYKCGVLIRKIIDGGNVIIMVEDTLKNKPVLSFKFNEKNFTGLMKKYRDPKEVRQMIKNLFLVKR